jgi:hypothetical protein
VSRASRTQSGQARGNIQSSRVFGWMSASIREPWRPIASRNTRFQSMRSIRNTNRASAAARAA